MNAVNYKSCFITYPYDHFGNYLEHFNAGSVNAGGIAVIPEPTTLLLLGMGAVLFRKR